ncbi:hypothetical protein HD554DRAFT_1314714 [Boletus coccyginus]|nr:hypothetical protein HD554DRAFT_1314714 [Boletus coccyginus]
MDLFAYIDRIEPYSPTSTTPTGTSFPPFDDPGPRSFSQLKELGLGVYKDVWNEFYDWEPGYCVEILGTVTQSLLASKRQVARVARAMVARLLDDALQHSIPKRMVDADGTDSVVMSVTHFDASAGHRGVHGRTTDVSIPVFTIDAYPPHPKYESCPPVSRSVLVDGAQEHILAFLPYADDDRFPAQEYQARFEILEWETPFDPDVEMIQMETVKRLCVKKRVDILDIDRMKMFKDFRVSHNTGLKWEQSQRDVLHWPGAFKSEPTQDEPTQEGQLPNYTPDAGDLRQRLMSNLRTFCPSINCLHSVCETHGQMHASCYIPSGKPQLTGEDMILSEGAPCGPDCFRHIQNFEMFTETLPPSPSKSHHTSSLDTLETVLGIAPDLFPCQLAIICLKPCKEVFVQRLQLFPDHTILSTTLSSTIEGSSHLQKRKKTKERLKFVDGASNASCALLAACAHPGSCTSNNCPCYVEKQHCTLMCRCGVKCDRQWKSCNCFNGRCMPTTCDCAKGGRECIPGICINCDSGSFTVKYIHYPGFTSRPCENTKMQRSASKPVEIKCGSYGLGAFAYQNMHSSTFLGTYVGHILSMELADPLNEIAKHTSLNYMFEVTPDGNDVQLPVFDAAHLGNATRFLNHDEKGKDNVEAKTMVVVGEHQIGFFTKREVKAGEELLLDYGKNYWKYCA